jgi:hypothetical protein
VAAARQAEVGAADPHPAVGGRVGKHLVEQFAVRLLDGVALDQRPARFRGAVGKRVAQLLQLTEVEHPGRPRGGDPVRHGDPAEALGDQPGQLQLELADLTAQLGARAGLVEQPVDLGGLSGDQRRPVDLNSPVEQIRHGQSLGALEGGCSDP